MSNIASVILIIFTFSISIFAQTNLIAEKYLKIKPAVSTREDVERFLGKNNSKEHTVLYSIGDQTIRIEYSDGSCYPKPEGWMFPEWIVKEAFYVQREEKLQLQNVIKDLSKFRKRFIGDVIGQTEYSNEEAGISVIYLKTEKTVSSVTIKPTSEQKRRFACVAN